MCEWVNNDPLGFERYIATWSSLAAFRHDQTLEWLSPLSGDGYKELRDGLWSKAQIPGSSPQQAGFWPRRGPQWDGVATVHGANMERGVLLVEAKSHVAEIASSPTGAEGDRLEQIRAALNDVKHHLDVPAETDWATRYYQITNRLAYLYYLRVKLEHPAWLLFVYFVGDDFGSSGSRVFPPTEEAWRPWINEARHALRLPRSHKLSDYVFEAFIPAQSPEGGSVEP